MESPVTINRRNYDYNYDSNRSDNYDWDYNPDCGHDCNWNGEYNYNFNLYGLALTVGTARSPSSVQRPSVMENVASTEGRGGCGLVAVGGHGGHGAEQEHEAAVLDPAPAGGPPPHTD